MINGTKLLNVVGMTRGRRDGILKAEKQKQVVKIGPMHLKGVWYVFIPLPNPQCPTLSSEPLPQFPSLTDLQNLVPRIKTDYRIRIPYERALALANQEKITEKLYPLFVHNIGALLYHPSNAARPLPLPPTYQQKPEEQRAAAEEDDRRPRL
jgi:protein SOK2